MDGCLDAWDILYQQRAPLLSIKVSDDALHTLKVTAIEWDDALTQ
jgi:hypothetical protein